MNATDAKEKVKSIVWTLPGVVAVGIGLVRGRRIGVIVGVENEGDAVINAVKKQFPDGLIEKFPIEVVRSGRSSLAYEI